MAPTYGDTHELLSRRADLQAQLKLLPYDGSPEVKEQNGSKYLYMRRRVAGRLTSTYVDVYSDELHQMLLRTARQARDLRKQLRRIDKRLAEAGYEGAELSPEVTLNADFARASMKSSIYDQAVLEGVATSFPQTEEILDNGMVLGMTASDVQKILNLKHAWEFVLDPDVLQSRTDYYLLSCIARMVNEGFLREGGRIRGVPVSIGGSSYRPPIPIESDVRGAIDEIVASGGRIIDTAVRLCLFCMRAQVFLDGNKRAAVLLANHFLIARGEGLLVVPEGDVPEFKRLLVEFYESADSTEASDFMENRCWRRM